MAFILRHNSNPAEMKGKESSSLLGIFESSEADRPGSALSQDSGNYDNGDAASQSGTDDEGSAEDHGAMNKIRACAFQLWQMSKTMQKNKHAYDLLNNNNGSNRQRMLSADSGEEDDDGEDDDVTQGIPTLKKSEKVTDNSATKCTSLLDDLSLGDDCQNFRTQSPKKEKQSFGLGQFLRQTFTVSASNTCPKEEEPLKQGNSHAPIKPFWSDFPPTKAKKAPRNMTYVRV